MKRHKQNASLLGESNTKTVAHGKILLNLYLRALERLFLLISLYSYSYKTSYEAKIVKNSEHDVVVFN